MSLVIFIFTATGRNLTAPIPVEDMAEHYLGLLNRPS